MKEEILKKLLEYIQASGDFILEQAPDIIKQALAYEKISTWFCTILMFVLVTIGLSVAYYFWKHPKFDSYNSRTISSFFGVMIPSIVVPLLFIQFCSCVDTLIKIYIAPKYFLIQLITKLNS